MWQRQYQARPRLTGMLCSTTEAIGKELLIHLCRGADVADDCSNGDTCFTAPCTPVRVRRLREAGANKGLSFPTALFTRLLGCRSEATSAAAVTSWVLTLPELPGL